MANANALVLTLDLNKDRLTEIITDRVEEELCKEFKANARDLILKNRWSVRTRYSDAGAYELKDWVMDAIMDTIKEAVLEYKEDIIAAAAHDLADSMRRSKLVREKFGDILSEELKE